MMTKDDWRGLIKEKLGERPFLVVSNRQPYIYTLVDGEIKWVCPPSGVSIALDPVMRACGGTWIAYGGGEADRLVVDEKNKVAVPPDEPEYIMRLVWLSKEEIEGYYYGFSNEGLWPLCHSAYTPPIFKQDHWETYKGVNETFAQTILEEIGGRRAIVFIQDYHFALLPRILKIKAPQLTIGQFWHLPFPNYETFSICPWGEEVLEGLLGNDLLGFHIRSYCSNFLDSVSRALEVKVDGEQFAIHHKGMTTLVHPYPISVDFHRVSEEAGSEEVEREAERLKEELGLNYPFIGVGMDRIDYTKGIPQRLRALDRLLEKYPEYKGKLVFLQIGAPSRVRLYQYQRINDEIEHLVKEINNKYGTPLWKPIIYIKSQVSHATLHAIRRVANFCIVSSLHDGMNLVAKEFVSSRIDKDGVLILSQFTGAAEELTDALIINPYAIDDFALKIKEALEMPEEERKERMGRMREVVQQNDIYHWAFSIISDLTKIKP